MVFINDTNIYGLWREKLPTILHATNKYKKWTQKLSYTSLNP